MASFSRQAKLRTTEHWTSPPSRFLIISVGVALTSRALGRWLGDKQRLWGLIGAWLLFYAVFFTLMPN